MCPVGHRYRWITLWDFTTLEAAVMVLWFFLNLDRNVDKILEYKNSFSCFTLTEIWNQTNMFF